MANWWNTISHGISWFFFHGLSIQRRKSAGFHDQAQREKPELDPAIPLSTSFLMA